METRCSINNVSSSCESIDVLHPTLIWAASVVVGLVGVAAGDVEGSWVVSATGVELVSEGVAAAEGVVTAVVEGASVVAAASLVVGGALSAGVVAWASAGVVGAAAPVEGVAAVEGLASAGTAAMIPAKF
jgi:hypothetical protein